MAKSSKKSAPKVDVAPAVVPPSKAVKKGKRESADNLEKTVIAKKQKRDEAVEQATQKKKAEVKTQKKKEEASSSEESDSSESEEEKKPVKKPVSASNGAVRKPAKEESSSSSEEDESSEDEKPATKVAAVAKKTVPATNGAVNSDSSDEDNDDDSEESDDEPQNKKAKVPKVHSNANASKKGSSSDSSDDEDSSGAEKTPKIQKPLDAVKSNAKNDSSDGDDSGDDSSDEEPSKTPKGKPSKESKKYSSESEEESSSEEESEDVPVKNSKKGSDVEMVDAVSPKPTKQANKKAPQIPATPETGSKTLFVGNLSFSVEQADVENFFKDAGEVVDVRFASNEDGSFKGFGHVEFDTHEAAKKALELNGQELLGRGVRLDMARERGAYTASDSKEGNSFQSKGKGQGQTIFVRGFDKFLGEDEIKSSLQKHFGSCGEITRISIPKDYETGSAKGMAYMDFSDADSFNKALELDGAELGGYSLTIEEAKPRGDFGSGGRGGGGRSGGRGGGGRFGGRGGGGRSGGRDFGGRSGGRDFGGRRGGGRGGFGGRGGGGRGHGNKPNLAAAGTGRKTTFGDD